MEGVGLEEEEEEEEVEDLMIHLVDISTTTLKEGQRPNTVSFRTVGNFLFCLLSRDNLWVLFYCCVRRRFLETKGVEESQQVHGVADSSQEGEVLGPAD